MIQIGGFDQIPWDLKGRQLGLKGCIKYRELIKLVFIRDKIQGNHAICLNMLFKIRSYAYNWLLGKHTGQV